MPSLNSILDARPELRKAAEPRPGTLAEQMDDLAKMGMRHGKKDKGLVQKAHDAMRDLVDGAHCTEGDEAEKAASLAKANARHSKADIERIANIHKACKELGAECPSPEKQTGE